MKTLARQHQRARHNSVEYKIKPNESVSTAVVRAVSAVDGREPGSLPPLADVFDPDALDMLSTARYSGLPRRGGDVSFITSIVESLSTTVSISPFSRSKPAITRGAIKNRAVVTCVDGDANDCPVLDSLKPSISNNFQESCCIHSAYVVAIFSRTTVLPVCAIICPAIFMLCGLC